MASKTSNPFDEKPDGLKLGDETKTDNKVVETPEDKAGTAKDKPADAPDEIQNADGSKEPAKTGDKAEKPKTTRKRRTKAEIEADKAKDDQGGDLVDVEDHTFDELDFEKLPLSAQSGNIVGSVDLNQGAVPTLNISLQGWIGAPIIAIAASQIGDVETVLSELKKQAKKIKL